MPLYLLFAVSGPAPPTLQLIIGITYHLYKPSTNLNLIAIIYRVHPPMFSRFSQLTRHLSRPLPNYAHTSAAATASRVRPLMASAAPTPDDRNSRAIHTAACLIIGDEVLGGKASLTVDTNSAYMAKFCFKLGMSLKRIEVISDDEGEIIEAVRRMSENYDFVVTSGGIGPTHDDITYQSIAKAFGLPLKLHEESYERMKRLAKPHPQQPHFSWDEDTPARKAKLRMIELPTDESRDLSKQVLFPDEELWVPVACVNGNVHILPGVPRLFEKLIDGMKPLLLPRLEDPEKGIHRIMISTPLPESAVAPYLTELAEKVEPKGVKVGSYPRWGRSRNTVTLVGRDPEFLESLVAEVEKNVDGRRIMVEGEDDVEIQGAIPSQ
ncbi:putative molybdopterin binding protein [Venustampulla echinocandica]|uniref:Putative molybdopterin binding protein n=1 Tax=Venustampulla echinocandica TaxID=2656787 RepID=A0A370T9T0_9HELO|nr:putative molybdopterin binding protein [Venustampulla echinocandica]RDL30406.1 putative molybdopterin binding protein [Venustampulla echinocandica]